MAAARHGALIRMDLAGFRAAFARTWTRRRAAGALITAIAAVIWLPASQCLLLNVMDPWWTQTMVGTTIDRFQEDRTIDLPDYRPVAFATLPEGVRLAAIRSEDQRFYEHNGFDLDAIRKAWAGYRDPKPGKPLRGGSTISQQVARNVFLWQGRNWVRKGLEAWYTIWLEVFVPKDRILELYLNVAEMGPQTYGIEAAAHHWYDRPAAKLTAYQAASIISLLPSPTRRTPDSPLVVRHAKWIVNGPLNP